ncbi:MAG: hypothetical protein ABR899_01720 [Candidatus Krumholzibacteriaceae bacterium]|jgi:hypothetical protein
MKRSLALLVLLSLFGFMSVRASEDAPFSEADVAAHPELAAWLKLWTPPLSNLTASSFRLDRERDSLGYKIDDRVFPRSGGLPRWQSERLLYSPDSTWAVDFWFDQVDSTGENVQDVDMFIALLNLPSRHAYEILGCGTVCGFHGVTWLSASSFLVYGWEECFDYPPNERIMPVIDRFDLQDQRVRTFRGPDMKWKYLDLLEGAVREQWISRFPSLRFYDSE